MLCDSSDFERSSVVMKSTPVMYEILIALKALASELIFFFLLLLNVLKANSENSDFFYCFSEV